MAAPAVVRNREGKVALVTGATSGIGQAAAVQLATQGARKFVHYHSGRVQRDLIGSPRFIHKSVHKPIGRDR